MLRSLVKPVGWGTSAVLTFTAVNLLALSVPTPHHMTFLDPNGDGILTRNDIMNDIASFSVGLLRALLASCLSWWFLLVKRPPEGYTGEGRQGMLHLYWRALLERQALAVIVHLALSACALGASGLAWFRFA